MSIEWFVVDGIPGHQCLHDVPMSMSGRSFQQVQAIIDFSVDSLSRGCAPGKDKVQGAQLSMGGNGIQDAVREGPDVDEDPVDTPPLEQEVHGGDVTPFRRCKDWFMDVGLDGFTGRVKGDPGIGLVVQQHR